MILNIFLPKNLANIMAFFAQTTASICKNLIITLVFEKNANFFAENWQKSQKTVIITSTRSCLARKPNELNANNAREHRQDSGSQTCM
jgi:hypothetical protein